MRIIIKNASWEAIKTIHWELWKTLLSIIEKSWVSIHHACETWICWACMCSIEKGWEFINKSFRNEPWFPLWDDEVMTCIASLNSLEDDKEIILKTMY